MRSSATVGSGSGAKPPAAAAAWSSVVRSVPASVMVVAVFIGPPVRVAGLALPAPPVVRVCGRAPGGRQDRPSPVRHDSCHAVSSVPPVRCRQDRSAAPIRSIDDSRIRP
ncbi:hypothetical protein GCM10025734_42320 [Kitasatospora paranensis]